MDASSRRPLGAGSQSNEVRSDARPRGISPHRSSSGASMPDEGGDVFPGPSAAAVGGALDPVGEAGPGNSGGAMQLDQRPSW